MNLIPKLLSPFVDKGWGSKKIVLNTFPIFWKLFGNKQDVETLEGLKISMKGAGPFQAAIITATKTYEPFETELFKSYLREGMTVADVGASLGWYSLVASKIVGNKGKIYAFEPEPSSYACLLRNIELNNCKNIVPIRKAVSHKEGISKLYSKTSSLGGEGRNFREVETTSLNSLPELDVVKVDVEGAEPLVLKGLKHLPKTLFLEFYPRWLKRLEFSPEEFFEYLREHFDVLTISKKAGSTKTVTQYQQVTETLVAGNTNLLCVRKETK